MRRGKVWTDLEMRKHVESIRESLDRLTSGKYSYREAESYVRSDRRDAIRTDENKGLRVATSGVSNPTAEIVESQQWNRERLAQAARLLESAAKDIDTAVSRVRDVFSHPDDYYQKLESYRP